jgi:hypothetical protein
MCRRNPGWIRRLAYRCWLPQQWAQRLAPGRVSQPPPMPGLLKGNSGAQSCLPLMVRRYLLEATPCACALKGGRGVCTWPTAAEGLCHAMSPVGEGRHIRIHWSTHRNLLGQAASMCTPHHYGMKTPPILLCMGLFSQNNVLPSTPRLETPTPCPFGAPSISPRMVGSSMVAGMLQGSPSPIFLMVPRRISPDLVFGSP